EAKRARSPASACAAAPNCGNANPSTSVTLARPTTAPGGSAHSNDRIVSWRIPPCCCEGYDLVRRPLWQHQARTMGAVMSEQTALVVHPHPVLAQLSALHHFRIYADIAVVVVILALTN